MEGGGPSYPATPHELPEIGPGQVSAALAGKPYRLALIPEDAYDRMVDHYTQNGPKKYKYKLVDNTGAIRNVSFNKDFWFYFEDKGFIYVVRYHDEALGAAINFPHMPTREEMIAEREANYTGQRHRIHFARAPTAPGEPTRG